MSEWRSEYDPETHGRGIDQRQPPSNAVGSQQDHRQASQPYGQLTPQPGSGGPPTLPYGQPLHDPWEASQAYGQQDYQPTSQPYRQPPQQANSQQEPYPLLLPHGQSRRRHRRPLAGRLGKGKLAAIAAGGFALLLIIISVAIQGGKGAPAGDTSPTASSAAHATSAASKSPTPTAAPKTTAVATSEAAAPSRPPSSSAAPSSPPSSSAAARTTPAATPSQTSAAAVSCQPLNSTGQCYQAGDSCPAADRGQSGVDANGNAITCENKHGWRWELS